MKKQIIKIIFYIAFLMTSVPVIAYAEAIVVEGAVPNEASKQAILNKIYAAYGVDQVVDKIQVRAISAPDGWSDSVIKVITPDLKKLNKGNCLYVVHRLN